MANKIVTIRIVVNMNSKEAKTWEKKQDFFESIVDEALDEITSIRQKNRYINKEGKLDGDATYKVTVKNA